MVISDYKGGMAKNLDITLEAPAVNHAKCPGVLLKFSPQMMERLARVTRQWRDVRESDNSSESDVALFASGKVGVSTIVRAATAIGLPILEARISAVKARLNAEGEQEASPALRDVPEQS